MFVFWCSEEGSCIVVVGLLFGVFGFRVGFVFKGSWGFDYMVVLCG